ncbi:PREDICTED: macoilin-1-like [Amphimedon queenslandica]|uniref:Macoilin n=1 Tax=Amphimedon queenslandica TaxID=400682 RepID=A0A1X7U621_AMPQE|nr:PREDICTED: macoilin-1-like [Amphimedon queenslandica]|eukprot:XP_011405939.2 PREDICTED: macoilin-1-like [Amphimedon queenslandica]
MRRRVVSIKKLPSKKNKTQTELPQTSNYLHVKLVCGWGLIVFLDAVVGFRLEYLYPAIMFLRSVIDSYKYQGLIFSLFFIMLVVYLDIICWTMLLGPWLFFMASACVWLELIRSWDSSFGYGSMLLWMLFLYVEVTQRLNFLPMPIVTLLRPFGAHCIGYPVVTMSFQLKHQLTHVIRQRQQRSVSEENSRCFEILCKALPVYEDDVSEEGSTGRVGGATPTSEDSPHTDAKGKSHVKLVSKATAGSNKNYSVNGKSQNSKGSAVNNNSISNKTVSVGGVVSKRDSSPTTKQDAKPPISPVGGVAPSLWKQGYVSEVGPLPNGGLIGNGDVIPRPSSGASKQLSQSTFGLKKQALVKAVPRTDLQQQMDAREKAAKSTESLQIELKEEKSLRTQLESDFSRLEKEVKRLQADLHASSLQEEEANQRVMVLLQQERLARTEAQRLRQETETLQNRLAKLSSSKSQDMGSISSLEDQLKHELSQRKRLESQLREQRSQASTQNHWSREELKELKDKLSKKERDLTSLQNEQQQLIKKNQSLLDTVTDKSKECMTLQEHTDQLKASLADETRVKIELFQYLSEARKKQEGLVDELKKKDKEIESLKQKLHHVVALHSTWTPSLSSPHH